MDTNRCAIIAGSVIVGAFLLKRFTTVLGAESNLPEGAELPPVAYISQEAAQPFSPPAGNGYSQIMLDPNIPTGAYCDVSPSSEHGKLKAELVKIDAWAKKRKADLTAEIASVGKEAKAERDGTQAKIKQEEEACRMAKKRDAEAKAAKAKAAKEAADAKAKAEKEAARKQKVATATTTIQEKSQQTGFLAALQAWMASWGQDKTTATVVVDDNTTTQGFGDTSGKLEKIGGKGIQEGITKNLPF